MQYRYEDSIREEHIDADAIQLDTIKGFRIHKFIHRVFNLIFSIMSSIQNDGIVSMMIKW